MCTHVPTYTYLFRRPSKQAVVWAHKCVISHHDSRLHNIANIAGGMPVVVLPGQKRRRPSRKNGAKSSVGSVHAPASPCQTRGFLSVWKMSHFTTAQNRGGGTQRHTWRLCSFRRRPHTQRSSRYNSVTWSARSQTGSRNRLSARSCSLRLRWRDVCHSCAGYWATAWQRDLSGWLYWELDTLVGSGM